MRCVYTDREPVELPKYVYKSKNGFEIRKRIGEHVEYFGRFNDLETAIDELQVCKKCWSAYCGCCCRCRFHLSGFPLPDRLTNRIVCSLEHLRRYERMFRIVCS